jgi:hypothetical protein
MLIFFRIEEEYRHYRASVICRILDPTVKPISHLISLYELVPTPERSGPEQCLRCGTWKRPEIPVIGKPGSRV